MWRGGRLVAWELPFGKFRCAFLAVMEWSVIFILLNLCTVKETILQLHAEMEQAIGRLDGAMPGTVLSDQSYQIATDYWKRVKQHIRVSRFAHDAEEIDFFKNRKVLFTGPLEYYLLLYRYHIYAGAGSSAIEQFRSEETDRIRKFRETHAPFITYSEQGRTEWDD